MKTYLCTEHGEKFTVKAKDEDDAHEQAMMWGAEVIGEIVNGRVII